MHREKCQQRERNDSLAVGHRDGNRHHQQHAENRRVYLPSPDTLGGDIRRGRSTTSEHEALLAAYYYLQHREALAVQRGFR